MTRRALLADPMPVDADRHLAVGDDVEAVAGIALTDHCRAGVGLHRTMAAASRSMAGAPSGANMGIRRSSATSRGRATAASSSRRMVGQATAPPPTVLAASMNAPRSPVSAMSNGATIDPMASDAMWTPSSTPNRRASIRESVARWRRWWHSRP